MNEAILVPRYGFLRRHGLWRSTTPRPRQLAKETGILTFVNQAQKSVNGAHLGHRVVPVPLQIGSLPVNNPLIARLQVSGFRHRFLDRLSGVVPPGSDLENFDTPPVEPEAEIDLMTETNRRPSLRNKGRDGILDTRSF